MFNSNNFMKKNMVPGIIGNNVDPDQMLWSGSTLLTIPFWMLGMNKLEFQKSVLSQLSMIFFGTIETFFSESVHHYIPYST